MITHKQYLTYLERLCQDIVYKDEGSLVVSMGPQIMDMEDEEQDFDTKLAPYKENKDYELHVAYGDTHPHAITIHNLKMLEDLDIVDFLRDIIGPIPSSY